MFVKYHAVRGSINQRLPNGLPDHAVKRALLVLFCTLSLGCRNHRERLIEDFADHRFEQLDLVERLENFDEYSEDRYFASLYDISPADAEALDKILEREAPASFFAKSEMAPFLRPGYHYKYAIHSAGNETSALLLDEERLHIIFYHSRSGH